MVNNVQWMANGYNKVSQLISRLLNTSNNDFESHLPRFSSVYYNINHS